jgi:D-alanyl-D-alanine carboxypeptidase
MPKKLSAAIIKYCSCVCFLLISIATKAQIPAADSLIDFMINNKKKVSFCMAKNDTIIAKLNEHSLMPLASTVKILIAVEFAKQAGKNVIDENTRIPVAELNKYYLPFTDGNAHADWLAYEKTKKHIVNDSVKLIDVARGMIIFSSNANSEYLLDLLGLDNVKNNIQLFGLQKHTAIFPLVASLFIYQNSKKLSESKLLKAIKELPEEVYCKTIFEIHKALKYDTTLLKKFRYQDLTLPMQALWSSKLTASTTFDYVHLMSILNNRKFLDVDSYGILADILEFIMESPANQKIYTHFGMKGGSTATVLTDAFYATTKSGTKIEGAIFFNNLSDTENNRLQKWLNSFKIAVTQSTTYLEKLHTLFK